MTTQPESNERRWIWLLCLLAAIHVFTYSAAFPLINNVDEQAHFDLAVKYSQLHLPGGVEPESPESLRYIVIYGSLEYLWPPERFEGKQFPPPPWKQPIEKIAPFLLAREAMWKAPNHESSQPPLYYTTAGLWWNIGSALGFEGGRLMYWLRFLNIVFIMALVWLGYGAARLVFPGQTFLQYGVPTLVAFMPQSAFYSIGNDMLSALCFGAAFILLNQFLREESPGARLGAALGLALAATLLTKMTNLPLVALAGAVLISKFFVLTKNGWKCRPPLAAWAMLLLCALLPTAGWLGWCKHGFGDFTGSELKIQLLGWTHKPFSEWWHHPIFTLHGVWFFASNLMASFWQGEFYWHGHPLAWRTIDVIYAALSIGSIVLALANLRFRPGGTPSLQFQVLWIALTGFVSVVTFLAFLSLIYDFHDCFRPSREFPYFTSGRMMLGALIPFLLLFVFGLDRALNRFGDRIKFFVLGGLVSLMVVSEVAVNWPVFSSQYNWFHM